MRLRSLIRLGIPDDIEEIIRFLITGVLATIGNLATVWAIRHVATFEFSIWAGVAVGFTISFIMSKLFAFRSKDWSNAPGEAARFVVVYAVSLIFYWAMSIGTHSVLMGYRLPVGLVDLAAVFCGAAVMAVTSYVGHRLFTYRRTAHLA